MVICEVLQGKLFWLCALFLSDWEGGSRFLLCLASTTAEFPWLYSRPQYKPQNFLLAWNNYKKNHPLQSYSFAKTKIQATVKCVNILSLTKLWNSFRCHYWKFINPLCLWFDWFKQIRATTGKRHFLTKFLKQIWNSQSVDFKRYKQLIVRLFKSPSLALTVSGFKTGLLILMWNLTPSLHAVFVAQHNVNTAFTSVPCKVWLTFKCHVV